MPSHTQLVQLPVHDNLNQASKNQGELHKQILPISMAGIVIVDQSTACHSIHKLTLQQLMRSMEESLLHGPWDLHDQPNGHQCRTQQTCTLFLLRYLQQRSPKFQRIPGDAFGGYCDPNSCDLQLMKQHVHWVPTLKKQCPAALLSHHVLLVPQVPSTTVRDDLRRLNKDLTHLMKSVDLKMMQVRSARCHLYPGTSRRFP